jgi:hypothetical protein
MHGRGKLSIANFTGLSSRIEPSLSFAISLPFVRLKHQIAVHDHTDRETRSDSERRLDIEIAPNHLSTRLIQGITCPTTQRLNSIAVVAANRVRSQRSKSRKRRRFEQLEPVIIDLILKASVVTSIGSRLTFEHECWRQTP